MNRYEFNPSDVILVSSTIDEVIRLLENGYVFGICRHISSDGGRIVSLLSNRENRAGLLGIVNARFDNLYPKDELEMRFV